MTMYKTIRHGENSLQYTILPQNDDFRIEGKLTSAESSCSSSGRKSKTKRPRRRSFFAYLGLIFVCTVIVGAVLIPFLVSAECLPNPTDWFLGKNAEKRDKPPTGLKSHGNAAFNSAHSNFMGSGINIGKTVKIINQAGVEKVILRVNKTSGNSTVNLKSNLNTKYQNNSENGSLRANENLPDQQKIAAGNTTPMINVQSNAQNEIQQQKMALNNGMEIQTQNLQNLNQNAAQTNAQLKDDLEVAQMPVTNQKNQFLNDKFADNPPNEHFITEVRFEPVETVSSKPPGAIPTIVVTTLRNQFTNNEVSVQQSQQQQQQQTQQQQLQQPQQEPFIVQSQTAPNVRPMTAFSSSSSTVNNGSNSITPTSSLMTRIIQVPLLKAAAKKPMMPPVLVKTNPQSATANERGSAENEKRILATSSPLPQQATSNVINSNSADTVVEPAKPNDWIHAHWPFIDPSTYFQWTGYKAEDSVLLPALLGFTLVAMISIITVCLVARKKQTILSSIRKRNRNDVEENGAEDNATLLTTANLSDED